MSWSRLAWGAFSRHRCLGLAAFLLGQSLFCVDIAEADSALETAVKAAYLLKLPQFVDWPQSAFPSPATPFTVCVVGDSDFGGLLERAASGEQVNGRPFAVQQIDTAAVKTQCQLMYIGGDAQFVAQSLSAVVGTPVLTVTDGETDGATRGIVNFVIEDNRVRFEIDEAAANRNHLVISSKLLNIAANVYGGQNAP